MGPAARLGVILGLCLPVLSRICAPKLQNRPSYLFSSSGFPLSSYSRRGFDRGSCENSGTCRRGRGFRRCVRASVMSEDAYEAMGRADEAHMEAIARLNVDDIDQAIKLGDTVLQTYL
eukprot:738824-Amorphochlora_amoeboformis.AAC.1